MFQHLSDPGASPRRQLQLRRGQRGAGARSALGGPRSAGAHGGGQQLRLPRALRFVGKGGRGQAEEPGNCC